MNIFFLRRRCISCTSSIFPADCYWPSCHLRIRVDKFGDDTIKLIDIKLRNYTRQVRMGKSTKDYYGTLKISPTATASQIKTAYYKLCLIYHPDKNKGTTESKEKFAEISEAYKVLNDNVSKKKYDRTLANSFGHHSNSINGDNRFQLTPIQRKNSYDEWTRAHYGNAFRRSQFLFRNRLKYMNERKSQERRKLLNSRIFPTFAILSVVLLLMSFWD